MRYQREVEKRERNFGREGGRFSEEKKKKSNMETEIVNGRKKNGGGGQFVPAFALRESISQPLKKDRKASVPELRLSLTRSQGPWSH